MPRINAIALFCLAAAVAASPASAQDGCVDYSTGGWTPTAVVALPSDVTELAATGDGRLLAAAESGLLVYDLAPPSAPVLAGFVPTDVPLREVAVEGETVAALTTDGRLLLGVVTTPAQSRWVGELPLTGATLLTLDDGLVVVRQLADQLATVDVSDPKDPRYLGFLDLPEAIYDLRVDYGLAFAATQYSMLTVCSLADPALPEVIATAETFATGFALDVDFPRVRVANLTQIVTYDLSVPSEPLQLHITPRMLEFIDLLEIDRDRTFALTDGGHIHHLATAGPDSLAVVGHAHDPLPARHAVLAEGLLYVVRSPRELQVMDPASGVHPAHTTVRLDRGIPVVEAEDDHFYALDSDHPDGPLLVVSEIDPGRGLVEQGTLPIFGRAVAMDLQGDRLAFSTDQTTLAIVDIGDRTAPSYVSLRNDDFFVRDVVLLGDLVAFIGRDDFGDDLLVFFDRSSEPSLLLAGALRVPFGASHVVRSRDFALVRTEFEMNGIMLVDTTVPSAPAITDWLALSASAVDVVATGEYAFVLTVAGVVEIVDLTDPTRMVVVRRLELDAGAGSLALVAATLLVQDRNTGITLVDVADPAAAEVIGATWVPTTGRVLAGTHGFVTNDVFNRQQSHLPALCGFLAAVASPPLLLVADLTVRPNPFNPRTEIGFELARPARVNLVVFDLAGRRVRTLAENRLLPAGPAVVPWDGRDGTGRNVGAGVYLAHLRSDVLNAVAKLVLVR